MTTMLAIKDLRAYYGQVQALHGLAFDLKEGSMTTLLGANGAGKTTTLRAICAMVRATGSIEFEGTSLAGRSTESIVKLGIAHVPQGRGTFTTMTVEENLQLGAITRKDKEIAADIERMYGHFPVLKQRHTQQAGTLSGGEQQMLAVARALMLRPRLMLLDEPSFGLAPLVVRDLFRHSRQDQPRGQGLDPGGGAERAAGAGARRQGLCDRNRAHRDVRKRGGNRQQRGHSQVLSGILRNRPWNYLPIRYWPASPRARSTRAWRWPS